MFKLVLHMSWPVQIPKKKNVQHYTWHLLLVVSQWELNNWVYCHISLTGYWLLAHFVLIIQFCWVCYPETVDTSFLCVSMQAWNGRATAWQFMADLCVSYLRRIVSDWARVQSILVRGVLSIWPIRLYEEISVAPFAFVSNNKFFERKRGGMHRVD